MPRSPHQHRMYDVNTNLLTARQAAAYLGVHLNTLTRLTAKHGLPFYRIGTRDRRFRREEIDAWLRKRRT